MSSDLQIGHSGGAYHNKQQTNQTNVKLKESKEMFREICHACLSTFRPLHDVSAASVKSLTGLKGRRWRMCGECAARLRSFRSFRAKVRKSHEILSGDVSQESVESFRSANARLYSRPSLSTTETLLVHVGSPSDSNEVLTHERPKSPAPIKADTPTPTTVTAPTTTTTKTSSRVVLETEQYKVIKLNTDQLLAEMAANMKSLRYINAPYKCTLCVKGFNYEDVLHNHMVKHQPHNNGDFECELCHQFFPSAVSMRGHKKSHSTKYQCKRCGVVKASRQHLLEHYMLVHEGAPRTYICTVCGKTLTKRTMFQKHMKIHNPLSKVTCDKCGKLFKTIETLRAHMVHHEEGTMIRHGDVKRYSCEECQKTFRYASTLYAHKVTHVTTKEYYCFECDQHFKTQSNLRLHLKKSKRHVNPDLLTYACKECDKRYEDEKGLQHHIEWVHLKQKNHKCPKCNMVFGSQDGLRSHRKKIHDGIRPPRRHICEICNKGFMARAVLVKHKRTHTGERPFECAECGKKFAQHSTMTTHIKLVHLKIQRQVNRKKSHESPKKEEVHLTPNVMLHMPTTALPELNDATAMCYYTSGNGMEPVRSMCTQLMPAPIQYDDTLRENNTF